MIDKSKRWKTMPCGAGEECWCRMIVMEDAEGLDGYEAPDDPRYICGGGQISQDAAEYFVQLHNERLGGGGDSHLSRE